MRTLAARSAFNKVVIVLKLSSFSRNVIIGLSFHFSLPVKTLVACAAFNKEVRVLNYSAFLFVENITSHN